MGRRDVASRRRDVASRRRDAVGRRRAATLIVVCVVVALAAWKLAPGDHSESGASNLPPGAEPVDPSQFATGACIAFPPTEGDKHETVFLDAGHGGIDPGAVGTTESGQTIYEADETLPVELDAMTLLRSQGFRVVVSRTGPTTVAALGPDDEQGDVLTLQGSHDDVAARDVCANEAGADVLVGIYFDAGSSSDEAGSIAAYDADRPFSQQNLRVATLVQNEVLSELNSHGWQIPDDGVVTDSSLGSYVGSPDEGGIAAEAANYDHLLLIGPSDAGFFSTPSRMPGTVVEPLYITDPFEGSIAASKSGQQAIARGIDLAVEQYYAAPAK
ncbi:MAG: N-acetylmuramoyl-L-alanine amidase [Acidimicrobiales bacterium]